MHHSSLGDLEIVGRMDKIDCVIYHKAKSTVKPHDITAVGILG